MAVTVAVSPVGLALVGVALAMVRVAFARDARRRGLDRQPEMLGIEGEMDDGDRFVQQQAGHCENPSHEADHGPRA